MPAAKEIKNKLPAARKTKNVLSVEINRKKRPQIPFKSLSVPINSPNSCIFHSEKRKRLNEYYIPKQAYAYQELLPIIIDLIAVHSLLLRNNGSRLIVFFLHKQEYELFKIFICALFVKKNMFFMK